MISVSSPERPSTRTRTASICASSASSVSSAIARRLISSSCSFIGIVGSPGRRYVARATNKKPCGRKPTWSLVRGCGKGAALCCCGAERAFRGAHQLGKQCVAFLRELRQHLAIALDAGFLQAIHQAAVRDAVFARERIDTRNPQGSELALFLLAIPIGISEALFERRASLTIKFAPADEAGGELELTLMTAARLGSAFGARHPSQFLPC